MRRRVLIAFAVSLLLGLVLGYSASAALAQGETPEPPTDNEVNAIAKGLYCPVCENVPLDACGTLACQRWREQIGDFLAAGWSEDEIQGYFVEQFGDQVLATPPARGLNWLIYILPPLFVLAGAVWLAGFLRRWRAQQPEIGESEPSAPAPEDDYQRQLEEELEARR